MLEMKLNMQTNAGPSTHVYGICEPYLRGHGCARVPLIRNSWSIRPFIVFMYVATELRRLRPGAFCHILHNMRVLRLSTCRSPNITASARWEDIFRFRCSPVRLFKRVTHPYTPQASHVRILRHKHAPSCSSNRPISYVSSQPLPISYF